MPKCSHGRDRKSCGSSNDPVTSYPQSYGLGDSIFSGLNPVAVDLTPSDSGSSYSSGSDSSSDYSSGGGDFGGGGASGDF
jgi:uncharacterized membrane protein YgcG